MTNQNQNIIRSSENNVLDSETFFVKPLISNFHSKLVLSSESNKYINSPLQATENWCSPTLLSGEYLNLTAENIIDNLQNLPKTTFAISEIILVKQRNLATPL
jgi:hypothetical protein